MTPQTAHTFRLVYIALLTEGHKTLATEFLAASGMEAPSGGETGTGSTEGDSPTGKAGDAQNQSAHKRLGDG
jgi:hypothetical protein